LDWGQRSRFRSPIGQRKVDLWSESRAWLAKPLAELGLPAYDNLSVLQVERAGDWRWGSVEAAFLARVVRELRGGPEDLALVGLPQDLQKLLMLARASRRGPDVGTAFFPGFVARTGLRARLQARELYAFVKLLGDVMLLLPRFAMARAKIRGAELREVLAESSSRALGIVAW
jgi:phospholipid/cholesterol/gamma-HCH transport system permease protein